MKAADVSEVALVTKFECTVLHVLCCKLAEPVLQILNGGVYLICALKDNSISCTKHEVVGTKPFQLKQLGLSRGECFISVAGARRGPMRLILFCCQRMMDFEADYRTTDCVRQADEGKGLVYPA